MRLTLLATRRHALLQMAGALAFATGARAAEPGAAPEPKTPPTPAAKVTDLNSFAASQLARLPGKAILGDLTTLPLVTELVDYNAPDWRRSAQDMRELLATDARLGYAIIQTPRLDVRSLEAARVSLAVLAKDRAQFEGFYMTLAESAGLVDGPAALDVAGRLGLDRYALFNASIQPENTQALAQATTFASAADVLDTPAYVIGDKVFEGYLDLDRKRALIADARR